MIESTYKNLNCWNFFIWSFLYIVYAIKLKEFVKNKTTKHNVLLKDIIYVKWRFVNNNSTGRAIADGFSRNRTLVSSDLIKTSFKNHQSYEGLCTMKWTNWCLLRSILCIVISQTAVFIKQLPIWHNTACCYKFLISLFYSRLSFSYLLYSWSLYSTLLVITSYENKYGKI